MQAQQREPGNAQHGPASFFSTHRLFIALALACGGLPMHALAADIPVNNCDDSGPDTLREAVANAADGDVILIQRSCADRRIDLTSGPIEVPQNNLTIIGNGYYPYVTAALASRVFNHTGTGTLRLARFQITSGRVSGETATGGCIYSNGHVELSRITLSSCEAIAEGSEAAVAMGAGVFANTVELRQSHVYDNEATGPDSQGGAIATLGRAVVFQTDFIGNAARDGGALSTMGGATITYSTFEQNIADREGGAISASGGSVTINKSLLMRNEAGRRCGAICVSGTGRTSILDSTITQNRAVFLSAGELSENAEIYNSTIANGYDLSRNECVGALRAKHLRLYSTIVAQNTCAFDPGVYYDIGGRQWEGWTLTGSNNLIRGSLVQLPAGTLRGNPMLESLHEAGGPTQTHRLMKGSPAIDRGSNPLDRQFDQRGPGFPRVFGPQPDIGAYEVQKVYE